MNYIYIIFISLLTILFGCSKENSTPAPVTESVIPNKPTVPVTPTEPTPNPNLVAEGSTDFNSIPVPTDAPDGMKWEYQADVSDDFNYNMEATSKRITFGPNGLWTNWYHNNWAGPGLTIWKDENVIVADGQLQLITTRVNGETETFNTNSGEGTGKATRLGAVSSKRQIVFPVYIESRAKVPNSVLASGTWLLSPDDTQEIDFLEAWGGEAVRNTLGANSNLSDFIHLSHHVFIRKPFEDYQPKDQTTWHTNPLIENWNDAFHTYGVYWESPISLKYYIDGKLVKTTEGLDNKTNPRKDGIDPKGFTGKPVKSIDNTRTGLSKPMDILITMEDQDWRAARGSTPTDEEILNKEDHTFRVDWIRVYKPVIK